MNSIFIKSTDSLLYSDFSATYCKSFPIFEQRTRTQQQVAFADNRYRLRAFTDDSGQFVGFIAYWLFDSYVYVEHFAIAPNRRGKGEGSTILTDFLREADNANLTTILEIDPPKDSVSVLRQQFYERAGMSINPFRHQHPPYRAGFKAHELRIMSAPTMLTEEDFYRFQNDLKEIVMRKTTDC